MMSSEFVVDKHSIALDEEGFLLCADDWNEAVAQALAAQQQIALGEEHWEILYLARRYQQEFDKSPDMRPLVNYCARHLGVEKGRSIHLLRLFPQRPARLISQIAGLPRPDNCL